LRRLLLIAAVLSVLLAVAAPALGQASGEGNGNNNLIMCVNEAAQHADAAVSAEDDAETTLTNLLGQLNQCGVFVSDDDTTNNNEYTTINNEDTNQESDQEADSGNIDTAADINNWGDNAALCAPIIQSGNTGNDQGGQQLGPSDATVGDPEPSGDASELSSELFVECAPAVDQSAAS
jgi:type II secretory pathway pseudopilin PulG